EDGLQEVALAGRMAIRQQDAADVFVQRLEKQAGDECFPRPGAADKEDEALVVVEGLSETAKGSLVGRGRGVRVRVGGRAGRSAGQPEAPVHGAAFRGETKDTVR